MVDLLTKELSKEFIKLIRKRKLIFGFIMIMLALVSINTEADNKDKHFQKLILRPNRLILETVKDRTTIKKYDPEAVSPKKLKDGG